MNDQSEDVSSSRDIFIRYNILYRARERRPIDLESVYTYVYAVGIPQ